MTEKKIDKELFCLYSGMRLIKEAVKLKKNIDNGYKGSDIIESSFDIIFAMGMAHSCDPTEKFFDTGIYSSIVDGLSEISMGRDISPTLKEALKELLEEIIIE